MPVMIHIFVSLLPSYIDKVVLHVALPCVYRSPEWTNQAPFLFSFLCLNGHRKFFLTQFPDYNYCRFTYCTIFTE